MNGWNDGVMLRRLIVAMLVPLVGAAWAAAGAAAEPARVSGTTLRTTATPGEISVSSNWAGYALNGTEADGTPTQFTSVSGRWVQPRARCLQRNATYSAFWVGLGGASDQSQALEQIGTSANCSRFGIPRYAMWYELVPAPARPIALKVKPGNVLDATVSVSGTTVTMQIRNLTRRTHWLRSFQFAFPDLSSAEWIAEAPSACTSGGCETLPLANFGHVSFTHVSATTAAAHTGTLTDEAWTAVPVWLVEDDPVRELTGEQPSGAVPGDPSVDGTAFGVDWADPVPVPQTP
jgi:hypothetical protein